MKNRQRKILGLAGLLLGFYLFFDYTIALAEGAVEFVPEITIPGGPFTAGIKSTVSTGDMIGTYISSLYRYGAILATVIAMFMLVLAGWKWLMAAGSSERINSAKDTISGALVGIALLFGGYLLMSQISTKLVEFDTLNLPVPTLGVLSDTTCVQDSDCRDGYLCTHEIYLSNAEGIEPHCSDSEVEYLVASCTDSGDAYDNISMIEASCYCREARLLDEDTKCMDLYLFDYADYCVSPFVSVNNDNDGCASYYSADTCRANICYNKPTQSGTVFKTVCGISLSSMETGDYTRQKCLNITDVHCQSNDDCKTGNEIIGYCCDDRNNLEDYCRPINEEGVVCHTN